VVFCGNPEFAVTTLNALRDSAHSVLAVVCSPDKPRGRGRKLIPLPVKEQALRAGVPIYQPEKLDDAEFLTEIRELRPDCFVVVAFRILPRALFALPKLGSFNVHPSLLPKGRGPAPIRWTLLRGESETGVTIIHLNETIDGGQILAQQRTAVEPEEDFGHLHDRLAEMGAEMMVSVLDAFDNNAPPQPIEQNEAHVTKAPKLYAKDFLINWEQSAEDVMCRIRALSPTPGAQTQINGLRFKILTAERVQTDLILEPGEIHSESADILIVGTGRGALRLKVVQPEGKRAMSTADFLRGRPQLPKRFG
jgi:methionyl-tRNA formyltransferase